jgi:hypothetical protein
MDTDYIELTIKNGNNEFVVATSQIRGIDGLKNYIVGEIGTARFDLYKNNVHPKNLMNTKKAILNYFNSKKNDNLTVIIYFTIFKTFSNK